jgi:DNA-binding response OmpR family regulator
VTRILIVDDDPAIRGLLVELLTDEGYQTLQASDGLEAIERARASSPSLVLMDLMLPVLDGAAATRTLKSEASTARIPIIAMSAGANLRQQADILPADGVLAKPFDLDELLAEVAIQLRKSTRAEQSSS